MSSVRELEIKNALNRKRLMQVMFKHLKDTGVEVELTEETQENYLGMKFQESVIKVKNKNVDTIRLVGLDSGGCGVPGNIMQFQYEIHTRKELSKGLVERLSAKTWGIKEHKIAGLFGGKVTGFKWIGKEFAEFLNRDTKITEALEKCTKSWSYLEFSVIGYPLEIDILGTRFTDPDRIIQFLETEIKKDIECCLFGFEVVENIAKNADEFIMTRK